MAGYNISINSKFNPFSYQELLAPVMAETQAHKTTEEAYGALDAEAAQWENLLDPIRDKDLYDQYKNYRQGIANMVDKLNTEGYYQNAYKDALAKRSQYVQDIMPIKSAYDRWQNDIKVQADARAKDPTRIFDLDADSLSTSDYYRNRGLNASTAQVSGEVLRKQVLETAQQYARVLTKTGSLEPLGIPFKYTKQFRNGATEKEVMDAILNNPNAKPILNNIVKSVLSGSGIDQWNSVVNNGGEQSAKYQQAYALASQGLYGALGSTTHENLEDTYNMNVLSYKAKKAVDAQGAIPTIRTVYNEWLDPESSENYKKATAAYKEIAEFNKKYGDPTGRKTLADTLYELAESAGEKNFDYKKLQEYLKAHPELIPEDHPEKEKLEAAIKGNGFTNPRGWLPLSEVLSKSENSNLRKRLIRGAYAKDFLSDDAINYLESYANTTNTAPSFENITNWHNEGTANLMPKGVYVTSQLNSSNAAGMTNNLLDQWRQSDGDGKNTYKEGVFYALGKYGRKTGNPLKSKDIENLIGNKQFTNFTYYTGSDAFKATKADNKEREEGFILHFSKTDASDKTIKSSSVFVPLNSFDTETRGVVNTMKSRYEEYINKVINNNAYTKDQKNLIINNAYKKYADSVVQALVSLYSVRTKEAGSDLEDPFKLGLN